MQTSQAALQTSTQNQSLYIHELTAYKLNHTLSVKITVINNNEQKQTKYTQTQPS